MSTPGAFPTGGCFAYGSRERSHSGKALFETLWRVVFHLKWQQVYVLKSHVILNRSTQDSYTRCHENTDIARSRVLPVCQCYVA
jgi:hypothetical protein